MAFTLPKPKDCIECGGNGVFHRITFIDVLLKSIVDRIFTGNEQKGILSQKLQRLERTIAPTIFNFCIRTGLARKQNEIDSHTSLLAQMLWKEATQRGIKVWEFRLFGFPRNIFFAEFPNGKRITYEGIPVPPHAIHEVPWLDDKAVMKKHFRILGLPVAKGEAVLTKRKAVEVFKSMEAPVIVKPRAGSGSRHTTLHIKDEHELIRAFSVAQRVSHRVVVEEELWGAVYRATVVDGKLVAVLRRDQPYVEGDGVNTIHELVKKANTHPARSGPYFSKIKLDDNATTELKWHGYTVADIPPSGKRVNFHQKVNWSVGGTTADVTDEVHPDNTALFERVAEVLKAPIVGIDFIISDMGRSWKGQERCGIIECNSMPFFDNHHLPFEGKPRNVARAIWDMMEKY